MIRRLIAFRPSRDTLLPNRGLLPQISQTADTETPIPYVIASGGRATKRSVVARADVMLGAKPPTMQARRDRPNPEKSAVRRSKRMQDTSARGPMLLLISRTSATRALALIGPIKSGSQVRDRTRPGPRCRHLRLEQQGSTVPPRAIAGGEYWGISSLPPTFNWVSRFDSAPGPDPMVHPAGPSDDATTREPAVSTPSPSGATTTPPDPGPRRRRSHRAQPTTTDGSSADRSAGHRARHSFWATADKVATGAVSAPS